MKKRILSLILALSMVLSVLPLGAFAEGSTDDLVMEGGFPKDSNGGTADCDGNGWSYDKNTKTLTLKGMSREFDFSFTHPQNKTGTQPAPAVKCAIESGAKITGGTFEESVKNYWYITDGTFEKTVTNIRDWFDGYILTGTIQGGTFNGNVDNTVNAAIVKNGTFTRTVTNCGSISGGTFKGDVINDNRGDITGGTFNKKVTNKPGGYITGGTFAGSVENEWEISGGVFNGKTGLDRVTGVHSITWDAASPDAKIEKVNGVPAEWDPYVVVTESTPAKTKVVTITANTEIYSLNGQPIGADNCNSSYGSDKKTVTFTMPDKDVVLSSGELVMKNGLPDCSNGTKGNGWEYDSSGKLILKSGTFDFSSTYPQNTSKGAGAEPVACAVETQLRVEITGGTFEGEVINNDLGEISGGTFHEKVSNYNGMITGGTFKSSVTSTGNGRIFGGVFNSKTTPKPATDAYSITLDAAYPNAKITEVNGVPAEWEPYVVVTQWTKSQEVTITADTEIFSLNGRLLGEGDHVNGNKNTVKFTMPNANVVLNKAITSTDLVMEKGWPKDSNGGKPPCKGDGWQYIPNDPTYGNMLLLTGSNQTGGLYDFSTIGDGSAVKCNVFVGKPTAITGGEFNGKVFNNSGILGGTFHGEVENMGPGTIKGGTFNGPVDNTTKGRIENGTFKNSVENKGMIENGAFHDEVKNNGTINDGAFNGKVENNRVINSGTFNSLVDNMTMGRIENGTFNDAVENNGTIEKGTFHGEVKNNGTINDGTFHGKVENNSTINGGAFNGAVTNNGTVSESITGSGTLNGELITKTPEPEPKPEPKPEPEPTTYTVTVIGGTIDGKTSVSAKENDTLTVVLDQNDIPDGMTFDLWSISSDKLSGDINVDYRAEAMTFQMPAEDVTIRAQYRSAEIIEDAAPSPLATAATIAVGGAAAGIVVWQGVSLGVDLYLANALPQGVPVPTDRRALALLLWETAGKPEVVLPTLYGDIPAEEIELQKATRWAVQNGLMDAADKKDASFFDPDHYVTKMDVFGAWLRLKKLLGTT